MVPTGKGVFIWQLPHCAGGDPVRLAGMAQEAGFTWVAIKAANGMADFNAALLPGAVAALRSASIRVWGWQYIYGGNIYTGQSIAAREAEAAVRNIQQHGFDGWILDPEREYKRPGASTWADTYMTRVRASYPTLPIGLCSYRFPSRHPELPWASFLRRCDFHAPQVYWVQAHNPGEQLRQSIRELTALRNLPIVPVGSAYSEGGWSPTVPELNEFDAAADQAGPHGVGWWAWDDNGLEAHDDWWIAVARHAWNAPPAPPPQDWRTAITEWARGMGYDGPGPE